MNALRIALLAMLACLLAVAPAQAGDSTSSTPLGGGCPAVQVTPWAPYVSVHPDCLDWPPVPPAPPALPAAPQP